METRHKFIIFFFNFILDFSFSCACAATREAGSGWANTKRLHSDMRNMIKAKEICMNFGEALEIEI